MSAPASPFDLPAFRVFFVARVANTLAQVIMVVVIGWQVYDLARQTRPVSEAAFLLGLVGLAQFLPVVCLSLIVGVIADRVDRRRLAAAAFALMGLCALALTLYSAAGERSLWPLFAISVGLGVGRALAGPAMSALAPNLVPPPLLPRAIAWNSIAWQGGAVMGPVIGGLAYDVAAPLPHGLAALLLVLALGTILALPPVPQAASSTRGLPSLVEGLSYVRSNPILLGAISLDLCAVILAGANAMLPIYARDILDVGPQGLGLLRSAPAVGAAIVAFWLTRHTLHRHVGRMMFAAVGLFAAATIVFGLSTAFWLSLACLLVLGAADMVSVYVRASLIQLHTPDDRRGRVSSVSLVFISASNELGEFRAGVTAAAFGPVEATVVGGALALLITMLWSRLFPALRDVDRLDLPDTLKQGADRHARPEHPRDDRKHPAHPDGPPVSRA